MKPLDHQLKFSELCWDYLKDHGYVYLAGKPRSGKTLTSLLTAEKSKRATRWLVLTKKAAIPGWIKFIGDKELNLQHKYMVINYEQLGTAEPVTNNNGKVVRYKIKLKLNPKAFDGVIIDESHNYGKIGKPSSRYKVLSVFAKDLPHIHLSGTAIVESPCSIYHQMAISKFSPFKHSNFYTFHKQYGVPYFIQAGGREIKQYDRYKPELLDKINEFTVYMTQEDAGISQDLQAIDKVHYIELDQSTKDLYNTAMKYKVAYHNGLDIVCDTTMKERTTLHMIESGIVKIDDDYYELGNLEKINYIKDKFGDEETTGIMSHFIGERELLKKHFKKAKIYSSNAHAEGVDLSHLNSFVIISSDYSGAKFIQRRDRIINVSGSNTMIVHHIVVKGAISNQIYNKVSKKEDFNNKTYKRDTI